jgi:hypothetical protein
MPNLTPKKFKLGHYPSPVPVGDRATLLSRLTFARLAHLAR